MAERFLDENDIKIIQDHIIQKSFYIRDRSCIANVRSKPQGLLQIFAGMPGLWIRSCGGYARFPGGLIFRLLAEEDFSAVPQETLDALVSDTRLMNGGDPYQERALVDGVVRSFAQARKNGKVTEWRAAAQKFMEAKGKTLADADYYDFNSFRSGLVQALQAAVN